MSKSIEKRGLQEEFFLSKNLSGCEPMVAMHSMVGGQEIWFVYLADGFLVLESKVERIIGFYLSLV
jgi:hypothetical protein